MEKELVLDYHIRYSHNQRYALKVIKALEEQVYMKDINRLVRNYIRT